MTRLLLIDKDVRLAVALSAALRRTGYRVQHVQTPASAPLETGWDLVLMDPQADSEALTVCRRLRRLGDVGIVMLTASNAARDRVTALRSGADDYITKPFSFPELHARLESVLHRVRPQTQQILEVGPLRVDLGRHQAFVDGGPVELTRKELQVLAALLRQPGAVVGREELIAEVWPGSNGSGSRSLDVHIATLRTKIRNAVRVEAVRGVGYRIAAPTSGVDETAATWQLMVISPRFGDAVLSVAGLVGRNAGQAAVITALGGVPAEDVPASEWDQSCGFTTAADAARVRAADDIRACQLLDADTIHLPHLDGRYATGDLPALSALLAGLAPQTRVLIPAGLGGDPDHVRVRDTALQALAQLPDHPFGLYAEQPDAATLADPAALPDRSHPPLPPLPLPGGTDGKRTVERVRLDGDQWRVKHRAVCAYASQLGLLGVRTPRLLAYPGPLQHEIIWWIGERGREGH